MGQFSNRLFGSQVEPDVIKKFRQLSKGFVEEVDELGSLQEINYQKYLGDRITFARMWAPLLISGSNRQEVMFQTLNDARGKDYEEPLMSLGFGVYQNNINELQKNSEFLKPKAGITSVTTKTEGSLGAIKRATIEFIVENKHDFDTIYQPYFLRPGATIILDFGWSDPNHILYDIRESVSNDDIYLEKFKEYIYGQGSNFTGFVPMAQRDGWIYKEENFGVLDVLIGRVQDFNAKYTNDERYECTVSIVSENASLLDKEVTAENDLKFLFTNKFEEVLIEVISSGFSEEKGITNANFIATDALTTEGKQQVIEDFFGNLGLKNWHEVGVLGPDNIKSGICYQDLMQQFGSNSSKIETGYISYGLFEDLFLNTLISENSKNDIHQVQFNTKETLVRYSDKLVNKQQTLPNTNEGLSKFLYPISAEYLANGYNSKATYKEVPEDVEQTLDDYRISLYENMLNGTEKTYGTKVIPLRDLFISIKTITEAFQSKNTVNDALLDILSQINNDSYGILNLQIKAEDSYSSVNIIDLNLHPAYGDTLTFNVTKDSIVSNLDLSFMMPKGGMSSMIAIGQDVEEEDRFTDEKHEAGLRFLEMFGPDKSIFGDPKSVFTSPIPLPKPLKKDQKEDEVKRVDFTYEKTSQIIQNLELNPPNKSFKEVWHSSVQRALRKQEQSSSSPPDEKKLGKISRRRSKLLAKDKRWKATSKKDYFGKIAKQEVFGSDETSPGGLIRGELSVTIFGNTYLNIGDYITINYLPKHIADKLIYLITNVEQKVGEGWETTYTTIAILKPQFKKQFLGEILGAVYDPNVLSAFLKKSNSKNSMIDRASMGEGLGATVVNLRSRNVTCTKIKSRFTKDIMEEVEEIGKSNDTIKQVGASFIVNEFKSASSLEELKFVMALQEVVLKYMYGQNDDFEKGAIDRKTYLNLYRNTPDYTKIEEMYNPKDGGLIFGEGTDFPTIFLVGLVEDAEDDGLEVADDNPNAAGEYIDGAQAGTAVANVTDNRLFAVLEHLAKRTYSKQFFDKYVNDTPIVNMDGKAVSGGNDKGKVVVPSIPGLNELEVKSGMILTSFGFQLSPIVQNEEDDPVTSFLFEFNLPFQGQTINNLVFLPEYFFTIPGISVDKFVDEVTNIYANNSLNKIFLKDYDRQFTEAVGDHLQAGKKALNIVENAETAWDLGSRWVKKKLGY